VSLPACWSRRAGRSTAGGWRVPRVYEARMSGTRDRRPPWPIS
jgi:hypothetical protein